MYLLVFAALSPTFTKLTYMQASVIVVLRINTKMFIAYLYKAIKTVRRISLCSFNSYHIWLLARVLSYHLFLFADGQD